MSQSAKTLVMMAVLLALAGGVGLYAYYGVYEKDATETKKKDHQSRLFAPQGLDEKTPDGGAPPAEFVKVSVTFSGQTTVLEREPGQPWRVTAPVQATADKLVVDALISQLQTAKFKATLEEAPDAETLKKYGLDAPRFVVEAWAKVGEGQDARSVKIEGGIENTFDGSVYLRRNGEPAVYTGEGGVRYTMSKTTYDLRDKQPFAFDEAAAQKIVVKAKANSYTLERNAEKLWTLAGTKPELAEAKQVSAMLGALAQHKAQQFADDTPANRTAFGLDKPQVDATITTEGGKTIRLRVAKGGTPQAVYGLREDESGAVLAEVPEAALNDLDRNVIDLRDRTIVRFKQEQVTKIVFHNANGTEIIVARPPEASAEGWRVVAPREGKAQVYKVTSVLWTLSAYRAGTRVEENPKDWGKYGIGPKSRFIALFGADGGELARFTIGDPVKDKPDTFYVRGNGPIVAEVDGSRFKDFPVIIGDVLELPKADGGAADPTHAP
jgi:hypothetical protein